MASITAMFSLHEIFKPKGMASTKGSVSTKTSGFHYKKLPLLNETVSNEKNGFH